MKDKKYITKFSENKYIPVFVLFYLFYIVCNYD